MIHLIRKEGRIFYDFDKQIERHGIESSLTVRHDSPQFSRAYREGFWDGNIRFFDKKTKSFPFGMIETVVSDLENSGHDYQIENVFGSGYVPSTPFKPGDKHEGTALYQHQVEALNAFYEIKHGIIKVSTRGGKTFIASEAIRQIIIDRGVNFRILFLVESELLFEQAIGDISSFLKINSNKIGRIKGEKFDLKQITVAMIQTINSIENYKKRLDSKYAKMIKETEEVIFKRQILADKRKEVAEHKKHKKELEAYFESVNFLIVDECHEFSNENRISTIERIQKHNCEFCLFLSATPFKSENALGNLNLQRVSGPIVYTIEEKTLKERGVLASDKIMLFMFNHDENKNIKVDDESSYGDYQREVITHNERRNQVLVNVIEILRKMKLKTLVLFVYKKHAYYIQSITGDQFLCSDDNMEMRRSTIKSFLKKIGGVLFASGIFKKGLTLPEVQVLYNAGGGLEQSEVIQKKGRVLGVKGKKRKAVIIDFIDMSKYFNKHSLSRIEVYEQSVGIENISIFDVTDKDFYRDVREFLKEWFEL